MKTTKTSTALNAALGMTFLAAALYGCSKDDQTLPASTTPDTDYKTTMMLDYTYDESDLYTIGSCIDSLPYETLSSEEEAALTLMREEEYLAHDVYFTLSQLYNRPIFSNIAKSEQSHTDAIKALLEKYQLPDPAAAHTIGIFQNPTLQVLYDGLVTTGSQSLLNGLITGATIEDLDIEDIQSLMTTIDNQDITLVFGNLERGSRNHLRSFYANIIRNNGTYTPQYISLEEFDAIVNSPHETGTGTCPGN